MYTFEGQLQSFINNVVLISDDIDDLEIDLENIKKAKIQYNKFKQKVK
jgi:ribosome maturation factor RimP